MPRKQETESIKPTPKKRGSGISFRPPDGKYGRGVNPRVQAVLDMLPPEHNSLDVGGYRRVDLSSPMVPGQIHQLKVLLHADKEGKDLLAAIREASRIARESGVSAFKSMEPLEDNPRGRLLELTWRYASKASEPDVFEKATQTLRQIAGHLR